MTSPPMPSNPTAFEERGPGPARVAAAWDALGGVYDPELGIDVVSLGLIYDVREQDGGIVADMTLTTPGCPASQTLPEMARAAMCDVLGAAVAVDVRLVWDPPWSPDMMRDAIGRR